MKDRSGEIHGMLTVLYFSHRKANLYYWVCRCNCGMVKTIQWGNIQSKQTVSCGCHNKVQRIIHGLTHKRIYNIYVNMIDRCYNSSSIQFKDYGGKGIRVCLEWYVDRRLFFDWAFKNGYEANLQLDRINNNHPYSPENCRFVTRKVNCRNKSNNVLIEYNGTTKCLVEWCEELGLKAYSVGRRIKKGWPPELALTLPRGKKTKSILPK